MKIQLPIVTMSDKKNIILLQSLDGKKKMEIDLKEPVLAFAIKNDKVSSRKVIQFTKKNKLVMT